jgi:hypothetical protein
VSEDTHTYESVLCVACGRFHFVNPATGAVMGQKDTRAESPKGPLVLRMFYGGNNLDKARTVFADYIRIRPRARITIRQRTQVLDQWPRQDG